MRDQNTESSAHESQVTWKQELRESPHLKGIKMQKKGKAGTNLTACEQHYLAWPPINGILWWFLKNRKQTNKQKPFTWTQKCYLGQYGYQDLLSQNQQIIKQCLHGKKTISPHASQTLAICRKKKKPEVSLFSGETSEERT